MKSPQTQTKSSRSSAILPIALTLPLLMFAAGCVTGPSSEEIARAAAPKPAMIPAWPKAGAAVADELDKYCPVMTDEFGRMRPTCPALDLWLGRVTKFKDEIEVLR